MHPTIQARHARAMRRHTMTPLDYELVARMLYRTRPNPDRTPAAFVTWRNVATTLAGGFATVDPAFNRDAFHRIARTHHTPPPGPEPTP